MKFKLLPVPVIKKSITGKSIVSINGVKTLLLWNVNPTLPEKYLTAINILVKAGYNNIDNIKETIIDINEKIPGTDIIANEFFEMHTTIKNKNEIIVTPDDILGFSNKYLDEHSKKSVIEKEVTIAQKRATDKKYQTYAFWIIGIMVVGGFIMLAWKIYQGGGT